jgi:hypothetical protein
MEIKRVVAASAGGVLATVAMSGWMLAGQLVSRHGEQPPKRLVRGVAGRAGIPTKRRGPATVLVTGAAHLGFGAAAGALYGALVPRSSVPRGAAFGLAVWATSYAGWIPALGLLPPPHKDRPGRARTISSAHIVYGAALGALLDRYDRLQLDEPQDRAPD